MGEEENRYKKKSKLYEPNGIVNFRLTSAYEDVRIVLNEKKAQGVNISQYLATLIRVAEGIEAGDGIQESARKNLQNLHEEQRQKNLADTVEQVLIELQSRGLMLVPQGSYVPNQTSENEEPVQANERAEEEKKKKELESLAKGFLDSFDDW